MSGEKEKTSAPSSSPYVEFCKGVNGLDKVILRESRGSSAEVYLYGAHVTSWKNDHGEELLFLSSKAVFKPPKAIRGGIPICFPQFGGLGTLDQHGFARNRLWSIDDDPPPFPTNTLSKAFVDLILKTSEEDSKNWPHRYKKYLICCLCLFFNYIFLNLLISYFELGILCFLMLLYTFLFVCSFEYRLRIALGPGGDLMLTSRIRNTNSEGKPFSFTFAYHTYFSVSDISEVRVEGLETLDYLDNLQNKERFTEQGDALTFESEVDKIYLSTPTKIAIIDHEKKRTFVVRKDGLPDAVVWNPWDKKAKAMADFGDDEYKHMLCVEAAAIEKPITLKPGEEWKGRLELSAVPSSYCSGQLDPQRVLLGS
ncbi:putative glucose-6-phosphate 1-epimerase isoform X1 [Vigna angularis]|uniref:putative glucose-6-phosphate 1-epimerase isoform X1 n=1 Tax=Phaseolus angularis TaxID=3914 RepID=UPI0022B56FA2|nr:putative glucose-6-phosphate 1-epimerase isoform X1 [Vigna angularis]XP_052732102.1 putative glucose-6-phosphate 1-epimerase isoform X1 [Vigna angularis]XP_052732103.1 putative glucose-6-phosphate 1-epimerase isoform X1 [Vigna angularis]